MTYKNNRLATQIILTHGSSEPEVFCKKGVLKTFAKFTGKHLCQSLFLNTGPATLLKRRLWHSCFPVKFAELLRKCLFMEHLRVAASLLIFMIISNFTFL